MSKNIPLLRCNAQRINDCFKSILQNSIEAIKEKNTSQKEGKITIKTELLNGNLVISFHDNGVGIDKEAKDKIFDMYYTTKGVKKSGTSLTIVKSTLSRHEGIVEIESTKKQGTIFRLIIPIQSNKIKNIPEIN